MINVIRYRQKEGLKMELYKGRPVEETGREAKEIRVYDLLDSLGIQFERTDHEPAMTMEACNEIDKVLKVVICKNLFLCNRQKTKFYLLLMPGDKPFKTKELSGQIGTSRLSFACAEDMEKYFNTQFGIQKTLRNIGNTWKQQINAAKAVAGAVKAVKDGTLDEDQAEATADALNAAQYGDRTEWIAKADAALAKVVK